jgi:phosphomannomutase/phosphoglucomutase
VTVFRAYDVRGVWGTEVTEDLAQQMGASFGSFAQGGSVSLGRDTRISGPRLEKAFLKGLLSTGSQVYSYGVLPISLLSFITWQDKLRAAAYISASHNPPEYNGIRFRTGDGYGLLYRDSEIMKYYREGGFLVGDGRAVERSAEEALQRYGDFVAGKVELERPLKVVLDAGNGSACMTGPLYKRLGFQSIMVNGEMDGRFPGRGPAPDEGSLRHAARAVIAEKADFGVGFDPDADRGIVIDDRGSILPPEKVAIIIARRRYKPGDLIISGFDCSMILERELEKDGFTVARERVGDVFIANRVKSSGAVLGVERSGHFFLPEFQYSDDPFAMSLALGEIISQGELSELADQIPGYPYLQKSIRFREDPSRIMEKLEEALARFEPDTTDGLKITTESYSVLIRPSNTEPLIRLYIETVGSDIKELEERFEGLVRECAKD